MKIPFLYATALLAALTVVTAAPELKAGDIETAKDHFEKGKLLVEEGAYAKAVVELKKSYELNALPIVLYNIAVCYDTLQRYALALQYYRYYMKREKNLEADKETEVVERIAKLEKLIGRLRIDVDVTGVEVLIDETLMGHSPLDVLSIETGEHTLTLRKAGYYDYSQNFTVVSDETVHMEVSMIQACEPCMEALGSASAHDAPGGGKDTVRRLNPAIFWASVGVTLALTTGLIVTGSLALEKNEQVKDMTDADDEWKEVRDEGRKLATATDVLIGAGALGAVTSLFVSFFTDFKKTREKPHGLSAGLMGGGALLQYKGRF